MSLLALVYTVVENICTVMQRNADLFSQGGSPVLLCLYPHEHTHYYYYYVHIKHKDAVKESLGFLGGEGGGDGWVVQ